MKMEKFLKYSGMALIAMVVLWIVATLFVTSGCATNYNPLDPIAEAITKPAAIVETKCSQGVQAAPSWELATSDGQAVQDAHPERRDTWTKYAYNEVDAHWDSFQKVSGDMQELRSDYKKLTEPQQKTVVVELLSTVAEYEASWNPDTLSKDVNGRGEVDWMATGLFQMNVHDQEFYKTGTKYSASDLKKPDINIKVGVLIMDYLIKVRGKLLYNVNDSSKIISYFYATLLRDTSYGKKTLAAAKKHMAALKFQECK